MTLLFDDIEKNKNISFGGEIKLSDVFSKLLYNLSETETYRNAVPQIIISVLNDKLQVEISSSIELSMGAFINGTEDLGKLMTMYTQIDNLYSITEQVTTYSPDIWEKEGKGIDNFIRYCQTRNLEDAPTNSQALGYHMYNNLKTILGI